MRKLAWFCAIAILLSFGTATVSASEKLIKVPTCWMDESPAFNIWYAKKMGWDKEEGLDVEMLLFNSGPAQMEALPSKAWVLGGTSNGGMLIGGMRYGIYLVSPSLSEGEVNVAYVRADHPVTKIKGYNPDYPDVYGSPETMKGMNVLTTTQTTVHYLLGKWLKIMGLSEKDIKLTNMDQPSTIPAFDKGIGDATVLWAPFTFAAEKRGWKKVASSASTGALTYSAIIGDREWCDANPEVVAKYLRVHFRVTDMLREEGSSPRIVKEYQQFMRDFCGIKMDAADAKMDLDIHPRWTYEEALKMADSSKGEPEAALYMRKSAEFFQKGGSFSKAELDKFNNSGYVTDKFLKLVKAP